MLKIVVWALMAVYSSACLYLWVRQPSFIFFPSKVIEKTPDAVGVVYEDVWVEVENGERLHGWWLPASSPSSDVLLYLHGNGINIGGNVNHAYRFSQLGLNVFVIDYRGYGLSEGGFPTEQNVYEDASAAWNYLVNNRRLAGKKIFVYGHSLGGAIAIELATRHPEVAGLIIEGSFTSMQDMVSEVYPGFAIFPIGLLLHQRFNSMEKIGKLKMPVLFIHGTADQTVPAFMSQQLFDLANEPKDLYFVEGGDHNNLATVAGKRYLEIVGKFIKEVKNRKIPGNSVPQI